MIPDRVNADPEATRLIERLGLDPRLAGQPMAVILVPITHSLLDQIDLLNSRINQLRDLMVQSRNEYGLGVAVNSSDATPR